MRKLIGVLILCLGATAVHAALQVFIVTPQTLSDWTVLGTDKQAIAGQSALILPAGAQLARSFTVNALSLQITTNLVVGENAKDWPVLELGSCALVFTRDGLDGKLLLVVGDSAPVALPFAYTLESTGRSVTPLSFVFSQQGTVASVTMSGQTVQSAVDGTPGNSLEVVFSAGSGQSWALTDLVVMSGLVDPIDSASNSGADATSRVVVNSSSPEKSTTTALPRSDASVPAAPHSPAQSAPASLAKISALMFTMEVFTPPSVRHGRADAIRTAVQGKNR